MHIFTGHTDEPDDSVHIFTGYTGELYKVACSPTDATLVATGGGDDKGVLWEKGVGDWAQELQGHKGSVSSLAFSIDVQLLGTRSLDGTIQVWDMPLGSLKCTLDGPGGELSLHPRLHEVLAGSEDGTVLLWSVDRDVHLSMFFGHASSVTCGDFTPDGKKSVPVLMIHHLEFGTLKPERTFTLLTVIHNIPKV
ncbi:angio-associated migratory cell protein-like isoform X1 [Papaver somniferum]|uniref:angio-associated migratory cell protein-like isoform X1 n=1 Tax=Papaver somniferum TaxID=3469 RepID=UPI000E705145|nr:angio-associated migratory cell protein-like isoform X1 [Papaver somniferum]XP_026441874.1 angio-associated migratory cell protein-like isoform X1 [Papaver somniferum]